jgi:biotin carboxyl carrier protein
MRNYAVMLDDEEFLVSVDNGVVVSVNGEPCGPVSVEQISRQQFSVLLGPATLTIAAAGSSGKYEAYTEARLHRIQVSSERERFGKQLSAASQGPARTEVRAPMPALVVKIEVEKEDTVVEGQGLVILEAMKMENEIKAHAAGTVKEIRVTAGKPVEKDEILMVIAQ